MIEKESSLNVECLELRMMLSTVEVFAAGTTGDEVVELLVDDIVVETWQMNDSAYADEFDSFLDVSPDLITTDQIKIRFTNDLYDEELGIDQNVRIDAIVVDELRVETESESVYSTGTWLPEDGVVPGYRQSEYLHANGDFEYPEIVVPGSTIRIFARGNEGVESFTLSIDGEVVDTWEEIDTALTEYVYQADGPVTADDVRISFINDFWDPQQFIDNNLIVDRIEIDSAVFQTEGASVYSTGTWLAPDGIQPGFRKNETLHTDGYFQYASLPRGSFALDTNYQIVSEDDAEVIVTVERLNGSSGEATVDYETLDLTAIDGEDYAAVSGTLVFADGEVEKQVAIPILADELDEDGEQFLMVIDNQQGAGLLSPRTVTIEIGDTTGPVNPVEPELTVQTEILVEDFPGAVTIDFLPDGTLIAAEFSGVVFIKEDGQSIYDNELLNITDKVNAARGMTAMKLHPDLENNPYLYLGYTYDPPEVVENSGLAGPDGLGNRASRLVRYTLDESTNYRTVVADSEVVLLGTNSTWENFNAFVDSTVDLDEPAAGVNPDGSNVQDFLAVDSQSHTIGDIEFGPDGALYVSNGDGASYNVADPRALRVQDIDNLSGKVLRIDPLTGEGLADNPFYDDDPNSNRSKVYQYGLRNPFRISVGADGQVYVGDVGWSRYEEINAGPAGANFGWPYFEGPEQTPEYSQLPEAIAFYASGETAELPLVPLSHVEDGIDAVILGEFISGPSFPAQYDGHLIYSHLASGEVKAVEFDTDGSVLEIRTLFQGPSFMTEVTFGPDGDLYFVNFGGREIGKWTVVEDDPVEDDPVEDDPVEGSLGQVI